MLRGSAVAIIARKMYESDLPERKIITFVTLCSAAFSLTLRFHFRLSAAHFRLAGKICQRERWDKHPHVCFCANCSGKTFLRKSESSQAGLTPESRNVERFRGISNEFYLKGWSESWSLWQCTHELRWAKNHLLGAQESSSFKNIIKKRSLMCYFELEVLGSGSETSNVYIPKLLTTSHSSRICGVIFIQRQPPGASLQNREAWN